MIEGTMKWTNSTNEFGFLTPDDGGRDVFVRLSSGLRDEASPKERTQRRGEGVEAHPPGEVCSRPGPIRGR